jgi:adhesin transport system outer membrane protein
MLGICRLVFGSSNVLLALMIFSIGPSWAGEVFTIFDAINQAVQTNPGVEEASANKRAIEAELRQNQSTLLPQVKLEAKAGPERFDQSITPPPIGNKITLFGKSADVVVRQLVFDGFATINQIWRQAARVDAGAARVLERTELIALDAAEAYTDVTRYARLVALAQENLNNLRSIADNVETRFKGGRSGEGDFQQSRERVAAAQAILAEFRQAYDDARSKYRKVVGLEPYNLRFPGRLGGLPASKDESLAVALQYNPTIRSAGLDAAAARYGFHATAGTFVPTVTLEGRAEAGRNADTFVGNRNDFSGKIVATWDIFRGGQDSWARVQAAEQYAEQTARHARLQREAFESLDKAWAARTITSDRAAALVRQVASAGKVVPAYSKEYELGQRTLIDTLDAQNQYFNAQVSLVSVRSVAVFADYQLLAAMGQLLAYLKTPMPLDAEPLDGKLWAVKIPPFIHRLPIGPEPLNTVIPRATSIGDWWYQLWTAPKYSELSKPVIGTNVAASQLKLCDTTDKAPSPKILFADCEATPVSAFAFAPAGYPTGMWAPASK